LEQTLTADLAALGYGNQTSIDFSPVLIAQMKTKHPQLGWEVMDVRHMTFADSSFDVAVDKATLDAMLYGSLWDPADEVRKNVGDYVDEVR
jgi:ubiquinone/menaquinone biosynthesis C-methylase UbiE